MNRDNVGESWTLHDEENLRTMLWNGRAFYEICDELGRSERGVYERVRKLRDEDRLSQEMMNRMERMYVIFCDHGHPIDYKAEHLADITNLEHQMKGNNSTWTMVSLLQENIITVGVKFSEHDDRTYTYKTRDPFIKEDDWVVVSNSKSDSFKVARVAEVHDTPQIDADSQLRYHWIVQRIAIEGYLKQVEADQKAYDLLVEAEKHVARKRMMDMYKEALQLEGNENLNKLLSGIVEDE